MKIYTNFVSFVINIRFKSFFFFFLVGNFIKKKNRYGFIYLKEKNRKQIEKLLVSSVESYTQLTT